MSNVLIGLVCQHNRENPDRYFIHQAYVQSILQAGGTPFLIPYQPPEHLLNILPNLHGLVLTGGVDVDPIHFGEQPLPGCGEINPYRDEMDLFLARFALEQDLPLLAICRGAQVLNVAAGGTLIQDIPTQVAEPLKHWQNAPNWYATHGVEIEPGSLLEDIVGATALRVNSYHHQAIHWLGSDLEVSARAADGVVEAVEARGRRFVLGLQWHPELMVGHCGSALAIFRRFVEAAEGIA